MVSPIGVQKNPGLFTPNHFDIRVPQGWFGLEPCRSESSTMFDDGQNLAKMAATTFVAVRAEAATTHMVAHSAHSDMSTQK